MAKRRIAPRTTKINFRLTEAEKQTIQLTAENKGISISKFIRNRLKLKE